MNKFVNKNIIEPLEINNIKDTSLQSKYVKMLDNERIYREFKKYYGNTPVLTDTTRIEIADNDVPVIRFVSFDSLSFINQGFSTRLGGVSSDIYSTMNLTFTTNDSVDNINNNFKIFGEAVNANPNDMVYSHQTHKCDVLKVEACHKGMGVVRDRNFSDVDALITNEKGITLVTCYADCIPVIAADLTGKSIGAAHAGWRGTVGNIAANMISGMNREYQTRPQDIAVFVGPGICCDCYEISEDVALQFREVYSPQEYGFIIQPSEIPSKYQLNLPMANVINLINSGVLLENIYVSDICTCCNPRFLFSHRATKGKRGILCNFISII